MSKLKKRIPKLSELVVNGEPTITCWKYSTFLSKVVISKCFSKYLDHFDIEDLSNLSICDAVDFSVKLASNQTDDDIKNLRNVLFTRMRNTLSNFIFRSNKLVDTEDEILDQTIVYPNSSLSKIETVSLEDLEINSIDSCRLISLRTWRLFQTNGVHQNYSISNYSDDIEDWETYSEVKNMKTPCDLINIYDLYTDDQIEKLASKLDEQTGNNCFNVLYQLLGDKFLPFLDVFQEDKIKIPSTTFIKHLLTDIEICEEHSSGSSIEELADKYNKSESVVNKILNARELI